MGRQSDAVKAMALALLNLADDEGYFYADPATVRSFARPFDDSSVTSQGCIRDLSNIGYIEVREHPGRGPIGKIVSFLEHQRIERPKPSRIKELFVGDASVMNHGRVTDESMQERKGKEGKGTEGTARADELISKIRDIGDWRDGSSVTAEHALVDRLVAGDDLEALLASLKRIHAWTEGGVFAPKLAEVVRRWREPMQMWTRGRDTANASAEKQQPSVAERMRALAAGCKDEVTACQARLT